MTTPRDPDRQIHAFLLEGDDLLNDQVYDVVRAAIEQKRQRTFIGPWRTPIMNKLVTYGLGAAAVVVLIFAGAQFFGSPSGGTGDQPTPTASQSNSSAPPPLTQSFTSTLHGISMSYPEGWTAQAATAPWTERSFPLNCTSAPEVDVMYDSIRGCDLFLTMASQAIGDATPEGWVAAMMDGEGGCSVSESTTVDGASGQIGEVNCDIAVVATGGRGYWIQLYTGGDDPAAVAPYDRAWFEEVLGTVQLQPEAAAEAPPPLTQTFTSTLHGISISYPDGWTTQPATESWTGAQPNFGDPPADFLYDPALTDHLFLSIASQPIGDATPDEWAAQELTLYECTGTEPTTVDGATGLIGAPDCDVVAVAMDGRGYVVALYTSGDDHEATAAYDRGWFEDVLATVQFQPEDAVD